MLSTCRPCTATGLPASGSHVRLLFSILYGLQRATQRRARACYVSCVCRTIRTRLHYNRIASLSHQSPPSCSVHIPDNEATLWTQKHKRFRNKTRTTALSEFTRIIFSLGLWRTDSFCSHKLASLFKWLTSLVNKERKRTTLSISLHNLLQGESDTLPDSWTLPSKVDVTRELNTHWWM